MTRIIPISIPEVKLPLDHYTYFDKWKNQYFFVTPRGDRSKIYHDYSDFVSGLKLYIRQFYHERNQMRYDRDISTLVNRIRKHERQDRLQVHEQDEKDIIPSSWSFIRKNPKKKVKKKAKKKIKKKNMR